MCWRFKLLPFFLDDEMKNGSKDFTRKMEIGPPLRFVCLSAQIFLPPPPPPPPLALLLSVFLCASQREKEGEEEEEGGRTSEEEEELLPSPGILLSGGGRKVADAEGGKKERLWERIPSPLLFFHPLLLSEREREREGGELPNVALCSVCVCVSVYIHPFRRRPLEMRRTSFLPSFLPSPPGSLSDLFLFLLWCLQNSQVFWLREKGKDYMSCCSYVFQMFKYTSLYSHPIFLILGRGEGENTQNIVDCKREVKHPLFNEASNEYGWARGGGASYIRKCALTILKKIFASSNEMGTFRWMNAFSSIRRKILHPSNWRKCIHPWNCINNRVATNSCNYSALLFLNKNALVFFFAYFWTH